eukprot:COSAG02_NODE_60756_length_270_cov_0.900585_1_plen_23_part_10
MATTKGMECNPVIQDLAISIELV